MFTLYFNIKDPSTAPTQEHLEQARHFQHAPWAWGFIMKYTEPFFYTALGSSIALLFFHPTQAIIFLIFTLFIFMMSIMLYFHPEANRLSDNIRFTSKMKQAYIEQHPYYLALQAQNPPRGLTRVEQGSLLHEYQEHTETETPPKANHLKPLSARRRNSESLRYKRIQTLRN